MQVTIMENNAMNLLILTLEIRRLYPEASVKGFTDGFEALNWCREHSSEIDLFIGNWWGENESFCGPEGANIISMVSWKKRPGIILCADDESFRSWSYKEGASAFLLRPVTLEAMKETMKSLKI